MRTVLTGSSSPFFFASHWCHHPDGWPLKLRVWQFQTCTPEHGKNKQTKNKSIDFWCFAQQLNTCLIYSNEACFKPLSLQLCFHGGVLTANLPSVGQWRSLLGCDPLTCTPPAPPHTLGCQRAYWVPSPIHMYLFFFGFFPPHLQQNSADGEQTLNVRQRVSGGLLERSWTRSPDTV